jgi:hypothetical protein
MDEEAEKEAAQRFNFVLEGVLNNSDDDEDDAQGLRLPDYIEEDRRVPVGVDESESESDHRANDTDSRTRVEEVHGTPGAFAILGPDLDPTFHMIGDNGDADGAEGADEPNLLPNEMLPIAEPIEAVVVALHDNIEDDDSNNNNNNMENLVNEMRQLRQSVSILLGKEAPRGECQSDEVLQIWTQDDLEDKFFGPLKHTFGGLILLKDSDKYHPLLSLLSRRYGKRLLLAESQPLSLDADYDLAHVFWRGGIPHPSHSFPSLVVFIGTQSGSRAVWYPPDEDVTFPQVCHWLERITGLSAVRNISSVYDFEQTLLHPSLETTGGVILHVVGSGETDDGLFEQVIVNHSGEFGFGQSVNADADLAKFLSDFLPDDYQSYPLLLAFIRGADSRVKPFLYEGDMVEGHISDWLRLLSNLSL